MSNTKSELGKTICSTRLCDHRRASRKRTAARMRILRVQLRETDSMLDAYNYTAPLTGYYLADVIERREAVRELKP